MTEQRREYSGRGTIRIILEIVLKVKGKDESIWSMVMSSKQAQDFIYKALGKRMRRASIYQPRRPVVYIFIPVPKRVALLEPALRGHIKYYKNSMYVKFRKEVVPQPADYIKKVYPKRVNVRAVSRRDSLGVDTPQWKGLGHAPEPEVDLGSSGEGEYSEFDH